MFLDGIMPFDSSLPDGTYQFGRIRHYLLAKRIPKVNEINQSKQFFIRNNNNEEHYKPIEVKKLCRLLDTLLGY